MTSQHDMICYHDYAPWHCDVCGCLLGKYCVECDQVYVPDYLCYENQHDDNCSNGEIYWPDDFVGQQ